MTILEATVEIVKAGLSGHSSAAAPAHYVFTIKDDCEKLAHAIEVIYKKLEKLDEGNLKR